MAPTSQTSGVIAQLTRNHHRASRNTSNSPHLPGQYDGGNSTITSFQPDRESTQQHYDTAADEQSWAGDSDLHSDRSNDSDVASIEVGRGMKRSTRTASARQQTWAQDVSEEPLLSIPDDSLYDDLTTTTAPPARTTAAPKKPAADLRKRASLRQATTDPDLSITKTSDVVAMPINPRAAPRRTLSDMHARIAAISDSSLVVPSPARAAASSQQNQQQQQKSRFSRARIVSSQSEAVPTRFSAAAGLTSGPAPGHATRRAVSAAVDATLASFALPDLPNIAELVTGKRGDGTPVFFAPAPAPAAKATRSRFTSAGHHPANAKAEHAPVSALKLPDEEKAIFASLQLLKEKMVELEQDRDGAVKRAEGLEEEMEGLRAQVGMERRLRRGVGGVEDERIDEAEWRVQKSELKAEIKTLHHRVERAERKASVAEIATKRMTQERDSLVTQLGVAFYSNEELKEENTRLATELDVLETQARGLQEEMATLHEANADLQKQLAESERAHDSDLRRWASREAELKARYKSRHASSGGAHKDRGHRSSTREEPEVRRTTEASPHESQATIMERVEAEIRKARAEAVRQGRVVGRSRKEDGRQARDQPSRSRSRSEREKRHSLPAKNATVAMQEKWLAGLSDAGSLSDAENVDVVRRMTGMHAAGKAGAEDDDNVTHLSFLDPNELSALRKKLEAERVANKGKRTVSAPITAGMENRKSSMRDLTGAFDKEGRNVRVQSPATADQISYSAPETPGDGDASVISMGSRRPARSKSFEEMTSAFILPDITIRNSVKANGAIKHESKSCTACPANEGKDVTVPRPVPVSERELEATAMTVRPAEEPKAALARVIKGLEDEIVHLKVELGKRQDEYARHEPAVGRSRREQIKGRMDGLVKEVERRSEMVYRLYDVLEGQKDKMEDTLRELNMDRMSEGSVDIVEGSMMGY